MIPLGLRRSGQRPPEDALDCGCLRIHDGPILSEQEVALRKLALIVLSTQDDGFGHFGHVAASAIGTVCMDPGVTRVLRKVSPIDTRRLLGGRCTLRAI